MSRVTCAQTHASTCGNKGKRERKERKWTSYFHLSHNLLFLFYCSPLSSHLALMSLQDLVAAECAQPNQLANFVNNFTTDKFHLHEVKFDDAVEYGFEHNINIA